MFWRNDMTRLGILGATALSLSLTMATPVLTELPEQPAWAAPPRWVRVQTSVVPRPTCRATSAEPALQVVAMRNLRRVIEAHIAVASSEAIAVEALAVVPASPLVQRLLAS